MMPVRFFCADQIIDLNENATKFRDILIEYRMFLLERLVEVKPVDFITQLVSKASEC
jgi:hypothetical protein